MMAAQLTAEENKSENPFQNYDLASNMNYYESNLGFLAPNFHFLGKNRAICYSIQLFVHMFIWI